MITHIVFGFFNRIFHFAFQLQLETARTAVGSHRGNQKKAVTVCARTKLCNIPRELVDTIKSAIPNRIAYFDKQDFDQLSIAGD